LRVILEAINGVEREKPPVKDKDVMFVRPIQRLAKIDSFRPDLGCLHVNNAAQATRIIKACRVVSERCQQIQAQAEAKFA
jgi:hypothetical protein